MSFHLQTYRGVPGLVQAAEDWRSVLVRISRRRFFHTVEWHQSYLETLDASPDHLYTNVIYRDAVPVAVLPLKQERRPVGGVSIRTLELPRHTELHLRDIIVADDARESLSLDEIVSLLKQSPELRWDVLALWHALDDSCICSAAQLKSPRITHSQERFGCSYVPLSTWKDLSERMSSHQRKKLRQCGNRCKEISNLEFQTADSPETVAAALPLFFDVEASGWKAEQGTAIQSNPSMKGFYEAVAMKFAAHGQCEIHLMLQGTRPIGGMMVYILDDTVYVPKIGFDEEFGRLSPPHLLFERFLRGCESRPGLKYFNLTSDSAFFDAWGPDRAGVYNVYAFNSTILGMAAYAGMKLAERFRREHRPAA